MPEELKNAFIGHVEQPTQDEVRRALGDAADVWQKLVDWLAEKHNVRELEWKYSGAKYGWSLRPKLKKRTIVHLSPCEGCFRVAFVLGDRAVAAARARRDLGRAAIQALTEATKYPEGTGVRFVVDKASDLAGIRKLAEIKLAN